MLRQLSTSAVAISLLLNFAADSQATILTFDVGNSSGNIKMKTTYPDYGDNVNSLTEVSGMSGNTFNYLEGNGFTPAITVDYDENPAANGIYAYSDAVPTPPKWEDVAFLWGGGAAASDRQYYYTFTPDDPAIGVKVNSFDLFRYTGTDVNRAGWTLYQDTIGGTVLDSGNTGNFDLPISTPFTVVTAGKGYFGTVILEIDHQLGSSGGFASDNINFDQFSVPEPSSLLLLGLGAFGLVRHTRRRRRRA